MKKIQIQLDYYLYVAKRFLRDSVDTSYKTSNGDEIKFISYKSDTDKNRKCLIINVNGKAIQLFDSNDFKRNSKTLAKCIKTSIMTYYMIKS